MIEDTRGADDLLNAIEGLAPDGKSDDLDALKDGVVARHRDAVRRRFRRAAIRRVFAAVFVGGGCVAGALWLLAATQPDLPIWEAAVRDGGISFLFWLGVGMSMVFLLTAWVLLFRNVWLGYAIAAPLFLGAVSLGMPQSQSGLVLVLCLVVITFARLRYGPMRRRVTADEAGAARASGLEVQVIDVLEAERRHRAHLRWLGLVIVLAVPISYLLWWGATAEALRREIVRDEPFSPEAIAPTRYGSLVANTHVDYRAVADAHKAFAEARKALPLSQPVTLGAPAQPNVSSQFYNDLFFQKARYMTTRHPGDLRRYFGEAKAEDGIRLAESAGDAALAPSGAPGSVPHVGKLILVIRALCMAAELDRSDGWPDEAVRKTCAAVSIGSVPQAPEHYTDGQFPHVLSLAFALEEALAALERALAEETRAGAAVAAAVALERAEGALRLREAYRSLRVRYLRVAREQPDAVVEGVLQSGIPGPWRLNRPMARARCRMALRQLTEAIRRLPPEDETRLNKLAAMCQGTRPVAVIGANPPEVLPALVPTLLHARMLRLAVALKRYRMDHDETPAPSQEALVPKYLEAVPVDPFSGGPFTIVRKNRTVTVQSAGPLTLWPTGPLDTDVTIRE